MKRLINLILIAFVLLTLNAPFAMAQETESKTETRYVSNSLLINMRAGEGTNYKILARLRSGTPLELISVNQKSGYSKVKTESGKTGYVLSRQLMDEPRTCVNPPLTEATLTQLENLSDNQIRSRFVQLTTDYTKLQERYQAATDEKKKLTQELAGIHQTASNAINIAKERTELRKQVTDLTRQLADLQQAKRDFENSHNQRWFIIGAAVLVLGILFGFILPRLSFGRRQDSGWGEL
jgi:SH3 domain protein